MYDCSYNEELEEYEKISEEEFAKRWEVKKREIFKPRIITKHERVYDMPFPLNFWDSRNIFQQYFFIETEEKTDWSKGGSGGSWQREQQGLWCHTFATLVKEYNLVCPTDCYVYNSENKLEKVKSFDNFKAVNRELSGNYQSDFVTVKELFENMLINIYFEEVEN